MQIHDRTSTANIHQLGKNIKINCSSISDHLPLWRALLEKLRWIQPSRWRDWVDEQESKLPTFWNTSFSKICLGMKINQQLKFTVIYKLADSLHSLIADGQYRKTFLGRDGWKKLIGSNASLQHNCNEEGFNAFSDRSDRSKVRIGIISIDKNDCKSCNSLIGFGTGSHPRGAKSCGNEAYHVGLDNGQKSIKAMGYILVQ